MFQLKSLVFTAILLKLLQAGEAYIIAVDAGGRECFHEKVQTGTKLGLMFEIVDGGFNDIEIQITDPESKVIHEADRETSGKYTFGASIPGVYTYCFINEKGTMTTKMVMFTMDLIESATAPNAAVPGAEQAGEANHAKLEDMIRELAGTLTSVKHEQEYMNVRDKIHRSINESTNSRVVLWSTFEALVLVFMTAGQVYYLKRFFEVRRVV